MTTKTNTLAEQIDEMRRPAREEHQKYDRETFRRADQLMEELGKLLNGGSKSVAVLGVINGLRREHRYLQNEAIISLLTALGRLPEVEGTDARNEFGIDLCRKVRKTFDDSLFWNAPKVDA